MTDSTSGRIIRAVCNELRNSDLRADSHSVREALDAEFDRLRIALDRAQVELGRAECRLMVIDRTPSNGWGCAFNEDILPGIREAWKQAWDILHSRGARAQ